MRNLVKGGAQDLLANELRDHDLDRLVRGHVAREPSRSLRQEAEHRLVEALEVEAVHCREHHHVVEGRETPRDRELPIDLLLVGDVGLGDDQHPLGGARPSDVLAHPAVSASHGLRRVHEHSDHVDVLECLQGAAVELLAQRVLRLVQARCVDEDHLRVIAIYHGAEPMPCGLGRVARDRDLRAHQGVCECGLARVGPPDQRHEPAADLVLRP